jgi:quercetin dioxygenase-like cupin family protein
MPIALRRVVTGHDAQGRAVVLFDDQLHSPPPSRPNHSACVVWSSNQAVPDNNTTNDAAQNPVPTSLTEGSVFRIVEYGPGVAPRNHRTDSVDYAVVLSGEIDMALDDGVVVHLRAGDVLVQRGTIHNWENKGSEPCRIAFVLIGAQPVSTASGTLHAVG